jgi:hypothetical protein
MNVLGLWSIRINISPFIKDFRGGEHMMSLSNSKSKPKSKICYDRRSVGQAVLVSSTHLALTTTFYYCRTVAGLLMWGALSDERTGLPFTVAAGPHQRSHSRVRVPWDSRPYFTVSDSRHSFSSPPTTRRATAEVFDPASARMQQLPFITATRP